MKKRTYLSFVWPRVLAGIIIAAVLFSASVIYLENVYNGSVDRGFYYLSDQYKHMIESYHNGKTDKDFLDIFMNLFANDYIKFAKVNEDGSLDTIYETSYDEVHLQNSLHNWIYVTNDESKLSLGEKNIKTEQDEYVIRYLKCGEVWDLAKNDDLFIKRESYDTMFYSDAESYGNDLFRMMGDICGYFYYRDLNIGTYYTEDKTLHLGKVNECDFAGKNTGRSYDFTIPGKEGQYVKPQGPEGSDNIEGTLNILETHYRPDALLDNNKELFFADNISAFDWEPEDESIKNEDGRLSYEEFSTNTSGIYTKGQIQVLQFDGQKYILAFARSHVSFAEFFKPVLIVWAILLLILSVGIPCLLGLNPYRRYKKAYENNIFKNNLIDSLAHNLKTPLQILGGYAENLKDVEDSKEKDRYGDLILIKTREMNSDIEEILKSAEKSDLTLSLVSVRECIEEAAGKVGCSVNITGDNKIMADKGYFKSALVCLIDNADKYKSQGSDINASIDSKTIIITNKTDNKKYTQGFGMSIAGRILEQQNMILKPGIKDGIFEARIEKI